MISKGDKDVRREIERGELYRELETESVERAKLKDQLKAASDFDKDNK